MMLIKLSLVLGFLSVSLVASGIAKWPFNCRDIMSDNLIYQPKYQPPVIESFPAPQNECVRYSHGVRATLTSRNIETILEFHGRGGQSVDGLDLGGLRLSAGTIKVTRPGPGGQLSIEKFSRENRSLEFYRNVFFPSKILNAKALSGKRVFDAGSGTQGIAVRQMRDEGILAFGGDIYLEAEARKSPYLLMLDLLKTPLAAEQFDLVLAAYGPISYFEEVPTEIRRDVLKELFRLTRPKGGVLISPYNVVDIRNLVRILGPNAVVEEVYEESTESSVQAVIIRKKPRWFSKF
jgi:SAM-dependent methyltransferase